MASQALKTDSAKTTVSDLDTTQPNEEEISLLAYFLWMRRGCPIGAEQEDWFQAEKELRTNKGATGECATHSE